LAAVSLVFDFTKSSAGSVDTFAVKVDGVQQFSNNGNSTHALVFTTATVSGITAGAHVIEFSLAKDSSAQATGFLDVVQIQNLVMKDSGGSTIATFDWATDGVDSIPVGWDGTWVVKDGIKVKVGSFLEPGVTATGLKLKTDFAPQAILFWAVQERDGASFTTGRDFIVQFGMATYQKSGIDSHLLQNSARWLDTDGTNAQNSNSGDNTIFLQVRKITSWDADGVTFDVTSTASPLHVVYMALGGVDAAEIFSSGLPAGTGNKDIVMLNNWTVAPSAVLFMDLERNGATSYLNLSLGAASALAEQFSLYLGSQNAATSNVVRHVRSDLCYVQQEASGVTAWGTLAKRASFVQFNSDGIRLNAIQNDGSSIGNGLQAMALGGSGVYKVGTLSSLNTTGDITQTGLGFRPRGVIFFSIGKAASASISAADTGTAGLSIGAADGPGNQFCTWAGTVDAVNPHNASNNTTQGIIYDNRTANSGTPTAGGQIKLKSFDSDGFTLTQTVADGSAALIGYMAFGGPNIVDSGSAARAGAFDPNLISNSLFDKTIVADGLFDESFVISSSPDISANIVNAAIVIGALNTNITAAASIVNAAVVTAALTTNIKAAASITDAAVLTAALSTNIKMAASVADAAAVTAALTTDIRLAAAITGSAVVTADLSVPKPLAAAISDAAALTAALTTDIRAAASIVDAAVVTVALTTDIRIAASVADVAVLTAALSTNIKMAGTISDAAMVTAALTTDIRIAASIIDAAVVTAVLNTDIRLAAAITDAAAVTAALSTDIRLAAAISNAAVVTAALNTDIKMAASVADTAALTAALSTNIRLAASITDAAVLTAALTAAGSTSGLSANIVNGAVVTAALNTDIRLAAAVTDVAVLSAALNTDIWLTAAVADSSVVTAGLSTSIQLAALIVDASVLTADLQVIHGTGFQPTAIQRPPESFPINIQPLAAPKPLLIVPVAITAVALPQIPSLFSKPVINSQAEAVKLPTVPSLVKNLKLKPSN
jgi:hypothetical protein